MTTGYDIHDAAELLDANQFLTFQLGGEEYGVEILKVQEIKGYAAITPIPNTPPHVKGVMNLRGAVVPILDLRTKFALDEQAVNQFTVIIVVNVGVKVVGLVVDAVSDVLNIAREDVQATPDMGEDVDTSFMTGIARTEERLIALLDIEHVVSTDVSGLLTTQDGVDTHGPVDGESSA